MPPSASAGIGDRIVLCDPGRAFARCGCPAPDSPPRFLAAIGNVWGQAACQLSSTLFPFHRCSPGYLDHPNPALRDETYTLRAVRFSRRQLALLRTRAVALWAQRGSGRGGTYSQSQCSEPPRATWCGSFFHLEPATTIWRSSLLSRLRLSCLLCTRISSPGLGLREESTAPRTGDGSVEPGCRPREQGFGMKPIPPTSLQKHSHGEKKNYVAGFIAFFILGLAGLLFQLL